MSSECVVRSSELECWSWLVGDADDADGIVRGGLAGALDGVELEDRLVDIGRNDGEALAAPPAVGVRLAPVEAPKSAMLVAPPPSMDFVDW